ncbi:hypothetical protein KJ940_00750 [Myxococcota bacterium]|nr:hypothetical protein [Myxococcota bacterium]
MRTRERRRRGDAVMSAPWGGLLWSGLLWSGLWGCVTGARPTCIGDIDCVEGRCVEGACQAIDAQVTDSQAPDRADSQDPDQGLASSCPELSSELVHPDAIICSMRYQELCMYDISPGYNTLIDDCEYFCELINLYCYAFLPWHVNACSLNGVSDMREFDDCWSDWSGQGGRCFCVSD